MMKLLEIKVVAMFAIRKKTTLRPSQFILLFQFSLLFISGATLKQDNADVFVVDLSVVPRKKEFKRGIFGKDKMIHKKITNSICE